jgi:hypothetical protein
MRTVLCYGDSNTWGYEPATGNRFPEDVRWPGVLARELGNGFRVIEEALNGRTTVREDPVEEYKNGKDYLRPCLESHRPLDLVIIALGVNDLKARFFASASDAADGAGVLVSIAQRSGVGPDEGSPNLLRCSRAPRRSPRGSRASIVGWHKSMGACYWMPVRWYVRATATAYTSRPTSTARWARSSPLW